MFSLFEDFRWQDIKRKKVCDPTLFFYNIRVHYWIQKSVLNFCLRPELKHFSIYDEKAIQYISNGIYISACHFSQPGKLELRWQGEHILIVIDLFSWNLVILGLNTFTDVEEPDPDTWASIRRGHNSGSCKWGLETSLQEKPSQHLLNN